MRSSGTCRRSRLPAKILFIIGEVAVSYRGGAFKDLLKILTHLERDRYIPEVLLTGDEGVRGAFEALDIKVFHAPLPAWRKGRSWPLIPWAVLRLLRVMGARRVDLIHVNGGYNDVPYVAIAAKMAGIPSVLTVRGLTELEEKSRKYRFRWVDRLVLCSKIMETEVVKQNLLPLSRVKTIYAGIDVDAFRHVGNGDGGRDVRAEFGIPRAAPLVGVVANLSPIKGYEELFAALALLTSKIEGLHCLCVGGSDPHYRATLERQVEAFGLQQGVVFAGYQAETAPFYEAIDLCVLPSRSEAFGLVLLEAMAFAKPIVATRVGGIPEVVVNGVTGLLVPPGDPSRLADAILRLLEDRVARIEMGLAGYARAKALFSLETQMASLGSLYQELLE